MGKRACYFKGVRLWEVFLDWYPWAARTGEGSHDGITQDWVYLNPESPNFLRDPVVECVIEPTEDHGDLDTLATMDVLCLDIETHLRSNAKSLGPLSVCLDDERKAGVGGTYPAGLAPVAIGASGGGWVPAGGRYVLFRRPSTGDGFVTQIIGTGTGTITAELEEGIDATWDVVDVRIAIPDVQYQTLDPGRPDDGGHECWRPRVTYRFQGGGEPLIAAADIPAHDTA
mgnify:CR=1 FL=1